MKRLLAVVLCLALLALGACGGKGAAGDKSTPTSSGVASDKDDTQQTYDRIKVEHKSAPIMRMLVISDTHNKNQLFAKAIEATNKYAATQEYKGFDAVVVVGDLTDNGTAEELRSFKNAFDNAVAATGKDITLITCMGNHDFGNRSHTKEENAAYVKQFEDIIGHEATREFEVNGVKFLALSPSNHSGDYTDASSFVMSKLKTYDKDEPVFVLHHYPFGGTVYGSGEKAGSILYEAVSRYTNVVDLSGHSHAPITNLRTLYQQKGGFSAYNCGSLTNSQALYDGVKGSGYYQSQQFSIFEVYDDNVTDVKLYDLGTDKVLDTTYQIGAAVDNTVEYLDKATDNPKFEEGQKVTIDTVGPTAVQVSFPQGTDDDKIEKYRVDVVDASGKSVANSVITSYYFKVDAPATLSISVSGLKEKTQYTATVTAIDFYGNESEPLTSDKFTTTGYPAGLTAVTQGKLADNAAKWQGATTNISDKGYFISSQGAGHYIKFSETPNLGDTWMASVDYFRATYNLTDDIKSYSAMQIGALSLGIKRGSACDYICLSYNYNAASPSSSVLADSIVIAKTELTSTLDETNTLTMTYEKGAVKIYRDGSLAISVTADQLKAKTGGSLPSFASSQVALRLNDLWVVNAAGATFDNFELKK